MSNPRIAPIDRDIASKIRVLRLSKGGRGASMREVADSLGITYQSYQAMEKGEVSFRASHLIKMARCFGVPVTHFFEGAE